jgi:antitoxin CptB
LAENHETRLKRLRMRSMRRGIKEMDLILSRFADAELHQLSAQELDEYETLLNENDQDLYAWITAQTPTPEAFVPILGRITSGFHSI